jgi:hypothetical protein
VFLHFDGDWSDWMAFAIFFYTDTKNDHQHDESDDAFFFGREDEEIHGSGLS